MNNKTTFTDLHYESSVLSDSSGVKTLEGKSQRERSCDTAGGGGVPCPWGLTHPGWHISGGPSQRVTCQGEWYFQGRGLVGDLLCLTLTVGGGGGKQVLLSLNQTTNNTEQGSKLEKGWGWWPYSTTTTRQSDSLSCFGVCPPPPQVSWFAHSPSVPEPQPCTTTFLSTQFLVQERQVCGKDISDSFV